MKILINQTKYSEKFIALTNSLHNIKDYEVGFNRGDIDELSITSYNPDILVHDNPEFFRRFNKLRSLQVCLHDDPNFTHPSSKFIGDIDPCIDVGLINSVDHGDRYACDLMLLGDVAPYGQVLYPYMNFEYKVRIFNPQPVSLPFYCGMVSRDRHCSLYRSAKASIYHKLETKSRLYEIVACGGTPVVYDPEDPESFHVDVKNALSGQASPKIPSNELQSSYNYIVMSNILKELGFDKLSSTVRKNDFNLK